MSSISRAATLGHSATLGASDVLGSCSVVIGQPLLCRDIARFTLATQPARLLIGLMIGQDGAAYFSWMLLI